MTFKKLSRVLLACTAFGVAAPAAALVTTSQAQAASYTLRKVTFKGNERVTTTDLQAALPYQPGQKIDQAGMQANVDALTQLYHNRNVGADISQTGSALDGKVDLVYTIAEKAPVAPTVVHVSPTVDAVNVTGNKKVSTADIIAASGIKPGDMVTNEKITAAQNAILALYKKKNVGMTVNTSWTNTTQGHLNLLFTVAEKDGG